MIFHRISPVFAVFHFSFEPISQIGALRKTDFEYEAYTNQTPCVHYDGRWWFHNIHGDEPPMSNRVIAHQFLRSAYPQGGVSVLLLYRVDALMENPMTDKSALMIFKPAGTGSASKTKESGTWGLSRRPWNTAAGASQAGEDMPRKRLDTIYGFVVLIILLVCPRLLSAAPCAFFAGGLVFLWARGRGKKENAAGLPVRD